MRNIVIILVALVISCIVGEEQPHEEHPVIDLDSALLVRWRDRLEVCVDGAGADAAAATLRAELAALRAEHPNWRTAGLDRGEINVVVGCPRGAPMAQGTDFKGAGGIVKGPGLREAPTPFRLHVHVVAEADTPFARAIAELAVVDEHRVAEVSTALVVHAPALASSDLGPQLAGALGLREAW